MKTRLCLAFVLLAMLLGAQASSGWADLFDGKSLRGWKVEGTGDWKVEDGAIVGRQGPNFTGGNIFTEGQWGDLEVEVEFRLTYPGNSGLWFRHAPPQPGYHVDWIDEPHWKDTYPGSLYVVGKGFVATNSDLSSYRRQDWNRMTVRAIGSDITVVLNGKEVVKHHDITFPKPGSIGLQVHAGKAAENMEVRVRKIRTRDLSKSK